MGVQVQWDNPEKTILRYDMSGKWTWDRFFNAYEAGKALMNTVSHKVNFILNPTDEISRAYTPPNAMSHMISIGRKAHPMAGKTVSISNNTFTRVLLQMVSKVNPKIAEMYAFADSLEDARVMLAKDSVPR
ncbi:MAG: hypothetical protein U0694_25260 [Anaerolineae bacterium]